VADYKDVCEKLTRGLQKNLKKITLQTVGASPPHTRPALQF
jgi:hypothetical protein